MDFSWSEDQLVLRESIAAFAERDLNEDLPARESAGQFPRELWNKCAAMGLQGLPVPEELGGQGADPLTMMIAMEALGYGCRDNGLIFSINAHTWSCVVPILRFGTEEQKRQYLPGLCDGSLIGVQGMTEPDSGSDAFSLRTNAEPRENGYLLNGTKTLITNAPIADLFVAFASTMPERGAFGLSAFLVERTAAGVEVGKPFAKMGLRTSPMSEVVLSDCLVPRSALLGPEGAGMAVFKHSMDWERACILASAVGTMQRQLEETIAYAKERVQFGQPIGKFQAVSHRIVDMKVRLETARLVLYRTGWAMTEGSATSMDSALVKFVISDAWVKSSLDALQVLGGYGYMAEYGVERDLRDAIGSRLYSGTSDIQKNLIAQGLGL